MNKKIIFLKVLIFSVFFIFFVYVILNFTFFKHENFIKKQINDVVENTSMGYTEQLFKFKTHKNYIGLGVGYDNSYSIKIGDSISKQSNSKKILIFRKKKGKWVCINSFVTF